jgi:hypothetical protein
MEEKSEKDQQNFVLQALAKIGMKACNTTVHFESHFDRAIV